MQDTPDLFFMRRALQLGEQGRWMAPPNPWVGCLLVQGERIIAEGYHQAVGRDHAEIVALTQAGSLAQGATAYISLEPCAHHGRTPPCVDRLIEARVARVVIPLLDPDPQVSGKGVERLRQAGIEVEIGVGFEEAVHTLAPYLYQRKTGRCFCLLKAALSIDGRIADSNGHSQWITGEEARRDAHKLRAASQAILIGARTAQLDKPQLTIRGIEGIYRQPLRILLDSRGEVSVEGPLADLSLAPTLIVTSCHKAKEAWDARGAEVLFGVSSLEEIVQELGRRQILQVLVEGGSRLQSAFLRQRLAQRCILYVGACLLGETALPLFKGLRVSGLAQAPRWQLEAVTRLGNDVRLDYTVDKNYFDCCESLSV